MLLTGDMVDVCSVHARKIYACIHFTANGTRFIVFWFSISTHIISEALNLISIFNLMLIVNNVQNTLQIEVDLCRIESLKTMGCVPFAVNVCIREMLFLTCTEHTSTMSPVSETQDYGYLHLVKGTIKIWSLRDDMCRIESQKAMKCVQFAVNVHVYAYVKCSSSHVQNILQPCHQLMKLRIMTICIELKVLIKFGTSEMMCIELRTKRL